MVSLFVGVGVLAGYGQPVLAGQAPATWREADGNPARSADGGAWSAYQLWPDEDTNNPAAYLRMSWIREAWRPLENTQGDMPQVKTEKGNLILTAGGKWAGRAYLKIPAVGFAVSADGIYGIGGKVTAASFAGGGPIELYVLKKTSTVVQRLRTFEVQDKQSVRLGGIAAELKAGDELVLLARQPRDNNAVTVTVEGLQVSTELADRKVQARARAYRPLPQAPLNPRPSAEEIRAANACVIGEGVIFPVDSGVLNVRAFGARGDGQTDDTAAIQAAYTLMTEAGIPIIDLHTFTSHLGPDLYCDHVHFIDPVRQQQGAFIAGWVLGRLSAR